MIQDENQRESFEVTSLQDLKIFFPATISNNPANPVKNAFSLLELLVAVAVMAILLVLLLSMVDSATKLWRENENRADSYREARAAVGIMSRDLRSAVAGATNAGHFLLNSSAFSKVPASALKDANSAGAVFFLSALPAKAQDANANKSDVCQVGYFLAYDRTTATTNKSLNLYRYFRSSDPTFTALTNNTLFSGAIIGPAGEELLARNVIGLTIRAFTSTNNTLVSFNASTNTPLPHLVEISVTAINQDAAKKLPDNASAWMDTNSAIIKPIAQTFITRIHLNPPSQN